ncbi:RNA polymerase sigma factor SigF [Streptomyces phaeoluteigriseus]|uniref:RNA polymerase sigma factor SigF n=1 Tax=Streptomyces phaeoluteigriseus TaxID=114686 RepID=A0ABY4Z375_9ACTN|nr:RNA polymerase sigma factor SigF [Streptomyces phaeoluteigriseus]USQ83416.1 RNA polymerase sigma factor SigF [Streptomyces phaeoluteigriseus]
MRNGDGPVRDEERGTRELPAESAGTAVAPDGSRRMADGIDGIPEQARPHPEDEPASPGTGFPESAEQESPRERRIGGTPGRAEEEARQRATGGTMSEHERDDEQGVPGARHEPQQPAPQQQPLPQQAVQQPVPPVREDRSGARAKFVELRALNDGSPEYAELRNQLVRMHLPLVEHLARRFRNRGEPLDDLTQVATIGLIKSVDRFDPDRGVEFSTYATPTVVGEIKRHFRDKGWAVRVPRRLQELRLSLTTATAELSQLHGRSPTVHELAERLAISEEEVLEGLESANAYSTLSLDVPDTDDESPAVADTLGAEDEALEGVEYRESLKPLLEDLPPREKRILLLRFFGNMTQSQIAQEVGISQMHVSRLLARTLAQLREKLLVEE